MKLVSSLGFGFFGLIDLIWFDFIGFMKCMFGYVLLWCVDWLGNGKRIFTVCFFSRRGAWRNRWHLSLLLSFFIMKYWNAVASRWVASLTRFFHEWLLFNVILWCGLTVLSRAIQDCQWEHQGKSMIFPTNFPESDVPVLQYVLHEPIDSSDPVGLAIWWYVVLLGGGHD